MTTPPQNSSSSSTLSRSVRSDRWLVAALAFAAIAPFAATLLYGYIYDDTSILVHNPVIQGWAGVGRVWKSPYWTDSTGSGLYRPFLMAIFAVLWNGAHKFAIAFHAFVLAMHALATVLLWRVLRRAVSLGAAFAGACWFAVHPVHVEAIASIANSSEILVAVFALLLTRMLLSSALPLRAPRLAAMTTLYLAALLTKESGAMIPALALVAFWGWCAPGDAPVSIDRPTVRAVFPMLALCAAVVALVAVVRHRVLGDFVAAGSIAAPGLLGLSVADRLWAMFALGGKILRLLVWPGTLNPHYGPSVLPTTHGPTLAALIVLVVLIGAIGAAVVLARSVRVPDRRPLAALLWILLAFLPASNLLVPTGQILAERTLYLSSVGVAMLVACLVERMLAFRPQARVVTLGAAGLITAICARGFVRSREYVGVWKDHARLFSHMIEADPASYRGYQLLAMEMDRRKRPDDAARLYERAFALAPDDRMVAADYAAFLLDHGRPAEALVPATRLMTNPSLRTDRRAVSLYLNATAAAWGIDSLLASARRLDTTNPSATSILFVGLAQEARGETAAARAAYQTGLTRAPGDSALAARLSSVTRSTTPR